MMLTELDGRYLNVYKRIEHRHQSECKFLQNHS